MGDVFFGAHFLEDDEDIEILGTVEQPGGNDDLPSVDMDEGGADLANDTMPVLDMDVGGPANDLSQRQAIDPITPSFHYIICVQPCPETPSTSRVVNMTDAGTQAVVPQMDKATMTPTTDWICSFLEMGRKCGKIYTSDKSWEHHMQKDHNAKGHKCTEPTCARRNNFWSKKTYNRHWMQAGHPLPCPDLPEEYRQERDEWGE